jgi:hypothetical protein
LSVLPLSDAANENLADLLLAVVENSRCRRDSVQQSLLFLVTSTAIPHSLVHVAVEEVRRLPSPARLSVYQSALIT